MKFFRLILPMLVVFSLLLFLFGILPVLPIVLVIVFLGLFFGIKKYKYFYLAGFIVCSLLFMLFIFGIFNSALNNFSEFTPQKWSSIKEQRYMMVDSLKKEHHLLGKNKEEIKGLLGKPDNEENYKESSSLYYIIEREAISFGFTTIVFNFKNNKVIKINNEDFHDGFT